MKTLFLTTSLMFAFIGLAQAELAAPTLLKPDNAANLPLKKSAKFTWQKVTGASKYRLIFSNEKNFVNYDANKFKCLNAKTCFLYTVASPSYNVTASHAMLKTDGNYFWQVQAVGKTAVDNSKTSEIRSFSVGTLLPPTIQSISANPQQITLGRSIIINAILDRALAIDFYTIKISVDGGESQTMPGSGTEFSFNFKPTEKGEHQFQIDIFDINGESVDSNGDNFAVTTRYTKIANNGSELPDSAILGANPKDWACTKDNGTGLIWEVKTNDGGLRDMKKTYTNYTANYQKCDWSSCEISYKGKFGDRTNTDGFVLDVNSGGLCGASDWRMPTEDELFGIVKLNVTPTIDITYFPNTQGRFFWSSSPYAYNNKAAWVVLFSYGYNDPYDKNNQGSVRLVRDGK
jgi:hypothetical protein